MPSDAFMVIPVGVLPSPGTCCKCGSNQRACIDIGVTIDFFGAILVCIECGNDLVNVDELNLMRRSEVSKIMADNERLMIREHQMFNVRKDLKDALVGVVDDITFRIDNPPDNVLASPEEPAKERFNFLEAFGSAD